MDATRAKERLGWVAVGPISGDGTVITGGIPAQQIEKHLNEAARNTPG